MNNTIYKIVPATLEHVEELAPKIRKADKQEIWASDRLLPKEALLRSMRITPSPLVGVANDKVFCMFGVGVPTPLSDIGYPWMLSSDALPKHARKFLREGKKWIEQINNEYEILINFVDSRNKKAIQWLKWLGFSIKEAQPYGPDQIPFHLFIMTRG